MSTSLVSALSSHTHARLQLVFKLLQTHTDTHIDTHFNHISQLKNIKYSKQNLAIFLSYPHEFLDDGNNYLLVGRLSIWDPVLLSRAPLSY